MGLTTDHGPSRPVWERSVTALGTDNERILQEISKRYPPAQFPFHIRVIGGNAVSKVIDFYIWNDRRKQSLPVLSPSWIVGHPAPGKSGSERVS
jgi:hypothetical protein